MRNKCAYFGIALLAAGNQVAGAQQASIEEIIVVEQRAKRVFFLEEELAISPDTSQLIKKVPGGNVNGNGPLTGIPQYRGMYGPRVGVTVNGANIAPAGPNWMDPPLSYAAPSQLVKLEVYRGIAPVSAVQESIGGAIISETKLGDFISTENWQSTGRVSVSGQSAYNASLMSGMTSVANDSHHFSIAAMAEEGDDAEYADGHILPTSYDRKRGEIVYGFQSGRHTFSAGYVRNQTGNSGTPSLPMDIDYFDGDLYNAQYDYQGTQWQLAAKVYGSDLVHGMTNFHLREAPANRALWRQNTTDATNLGFSFKATRSDEVGYWLIGADYFDEAHNGLIDNPNNPMFFVQGFNNASRSVAGIFIEREHRVTDSLTAELGLRVNQVESKAGPVDGTPARMMPPAAKLRDTFNGADRYAKDTNMDVAAKFWLSHNEQLTYYLGLARKTRSASFVERFLWLPLQATGGLADGFTYTGNLALDPEVSNELEFGFDYVTRRLSLSPRVFVREVTDFIQGTPTTDQNALAFIRMMNMSTGGQAPSPLQFNNVDARFVGVDMDWRYSLNDRFSISGLINYVRGKRRDIEDNLYRLAPPNASFQVNYANEQLQAHVEFVAYDDQTNVSVTNNESATKGYQLVNLAASYKFNEKLRLAVGANNLLDEVYQDHLGGYNRASNPKVLIGERLPGTGRNLFVRADITW